MTNVVNKGVGQLAARMHPLYTHECSCCRYLGQFRSAGGLAELYFHRNAFETTVIARFGNEGPDYSSGMCFSYGSDPYLTEARHRAEEAGLVEYNTREALDYALHHPQEFKRLKKELTFTEEYLAYVAYIEGDRDRSRGLLTHQVELELARQKKLAQQPDRAVAVDRVTSRLAKILSLRNSWDSMRCWEIAGILTEWMATPELQAA